MDSKNQQEVNAWAEAFCQAIERGAKLTEFGRGRYTEVDIDWADCKACAFGAAAIGLGLTPGISSIAPYALHHVGSSALADGLRRESEHIGVSFKALKAETMSDRCKHILADHYELFIDLFKNVAPAYPSEAYELADVGYIITTLNDNIRHLRGLADPRTTVIVPLMRQWVVEGNLKPVPDPKTIKVSTWTKIEGETTND